MTNYTANLGKSKREKQNYVNIDGDTLFSAVAAAVNKAVAELILPALDTGGEHLLQAKQAARRLGISLRLFNYLEKQLQAMGLQKAGVGRYRKYRAASLDKLIRRLAERGETLEVGQVYRTGRTRGRPRNGDKGGAPRTPPDGEEIIGGGGTSGLYPTPNPPRRLPTPKGAG